MPIQFGTDGWRAVISDTFTFQNLRQVTQAIADAVASDEWLNNSHSGPKPDPRRMVVGFDTRFLSDRYAVEASRVLAANGYKVYLTSADIPTPAVSYSVRHLGAIGGPNLMDYEQARDVGLIERFNPTPSYYDHLRTLIDFDAIADNPQHLVVDSMFGSGRGQIKGILQGSGCEVVEVRGEMNPGFGGIHPEPIAHYLGALAGAIAAGHGRLGIATDGDGDRLGAMDGRGQFVDPHRIMALALKHLVEKRGWQGKIVKTVSTTQMINRLGEKYGLEVIETPVGFNYIADWMLGRHSYRRRGIGRNLF